MFLSVKRPGFSNSAGSSSFLAVKIWRDRVNWTTILSVDVSFLQVTIWKSVLDDACLNWQYNPPQEAVFSFCTVQSPPGWLINVRFSRDRELVLIKSNYTCHHLPNYPSVPFSPSVFTLSWFRHVPVSKELVQHVFLKSDRSLTVTVCTDSRWRWWGLHQLWPCTDTRALAMGWKVNWWTPNG